MLSDVEPITDDSFDISPKGGNFDRYGNYQCASLYSKNFTNLFDHLTGKVLTIIDATIIDHVQRDAIKQLIKQSIWADYETLQDWMWKQHNGEGSTFPF